MAGGEPLLAIRGLTVRLRSGHDAVRGVDLTLHAGKVLGIVGESGSGKSMSMLAAMGLVPPTARIGGSVRYRGEELVGAPARRLRELRGEKMALIFQDPLTALNPVLGYEKSAAIAKEALKTGGSVYDLVIAKGWLTKEKLDELLKPENMTHPRLTR